MTRHLAKLLDAIWTISMGLFLGLTGGMVFAVIMIFRGARAIDASPGVEPFNDPRFAQYSNDAVAGYIGQDLFMVGGTVALVLLGIATIARLTSFSTTIFKRPVIGSFRCTLLQVSLLILCVLAVGRTAMITQDMNASWPSLYSTQTSEDELSERRAQFVISHKKSEEHMRFAWIVGLVALALSPWCQRVANAVPNTGSTNQK